MPTGFYSLGAPDLTPLPFFSFTTLIAGIPPHPPLDPADGGLAQPPQVGRHRPRPLARDLRQESPARNAAEARGDADSPVDAGPLPVACRDSGGACGATHPGRPHLLRRAGRVSRRRACAVSDRPCWHPQASQGSLGPGVHREGHDPRRDAEGHNPCRDSADGHIEGPHHTGGRSPRRQRGCHACGQRGCHAHCSARRDRSLDWQEAPQLDQVWRPHPRGCRGHDAGAGHPRGRPEHCPDRAEPVCPRAGRGHPGQGRKPRLARTHRDLDGPHANVRQVDGALDDEASPADARQHQARGCDCPHAPVCCRHPVSLRAGQDGCKESPCNAHP
eukprot:m.152444 g.152444  ORF g.152444 m.152444 type:complete len:331 (+) comp9776_c0_seq5:578-1570(+)